MNRKLSIKKHRLRAAIVGAGAIATGIGEKQYPMTHVKSYYALSDQIELFAFVEPYKERRRIAKSVFQDFKFYENIDDLLNSEKIDILSICTPDEFHEEVLNKAFDANIRGIWCEKPMALDFNEARKIADKARMSGTVIQVNFFRRFIPEIRKIKEDLIDRVFGDIKLINGFYADTYIHNGSHLIDLIQFFCDELKNIYAHLKESYLNDGSIFIYSKVSEDVPCILQPFTRNLYNIFELDIFCEKARIRICENGRRIEVYHVKQDNHFTHLKILNPEHETILCNWQDSFTSALSNLIDVVEGREGSTMSPPEQSLMSLLFIKEIKEMVFN